MDQHLVCKVLPAISPALRRSRLTIRYKFDIKYFRDLIRLTAILSCSALAECLLLRNYSFSCLETDQLRKLISVQVPWPLSLVVSRRALTKYQLIFRHLFHFKHVERQLCMTWQAHQVSWFLEVFASPIINCIWELRFRLQWWWVQLRLDFRVFFYQ